MTVGEEQSEGWAADAERIDDHLLSAQAAGRLAGALLASCGALVAVTAVVLPYRTGTNRAGLEILALATTVLGVVVWWLPWRRWDRNVTLLLVAPTMGVIALHDYFV